MAGIGRRTVMLGAAAGLVRGLPHVRLQTSEGALVIAVNLARAPVSGGDFLRYVDAGAYAGGRFFRVVRPGNDHGHPKINVVQGGVREGARIGAPVRHESTAESGLRHLDGVVSLTRDAPGTGSGSEFFICVGDCPGLDFGGRRNPDLQGFAAFGQVISGMDVVRKIWSGPADGRSEDAYTAGQILTRPVGILRAGRM